MRAQSASSSRGADGSDRHGADRVDLARAGTERDATRVALPVASVRHAVHLRDRVQGGALARR